MQLYFWPTVSSNLKYDASFFCRLSVTPVLWLNRTSHGSTTVQLVKAMTSFYRLSIVIMFICSGLAAILNAKLLPAAIRHVHRITASFPSVHCSVRQRHYNNVCVTMVILRNRFFSKTGSRTLAFVYRRCGRLKPSDSWIYRFVFAS